MASNKDYYVVLVNKPNYADLSAGDIVVKIDSIKDIIKTVYSTNPEFTQGRFVTWTVSPWYLKKIPPITKLEKLIYNIRD